MGNAIQNFRGVKPRTATFAPGGFVYHVLTRTVRRMQMFRKDADLEAFERVMAEADQRQPIRILSSYVMSNHWHLTASNMTRLLVRALDMPNLTQANLRLSVVSKAQ
jgi:REP element-mobilizing transposase RayT